MKPKLSLVSVCPCGKVATESIFVEKKALAVCGDCWTRALQKLVGMSIMVKSGTPMDVADRWSK